MYPLDLHPGLLDLRRLRNQKLVPLKLMHLQVQHSELLGCYLSGL